MLADFELSPEEEAAGVNRFDKYGFFNTLKRMTNGQPWMYNKLLECPAIDVVTTILHNLEESEYQKDYFELTKPKV